METANNINTNNNNSQRMIQEAIRKIALGRSFDRANMSPAGLGCHNRFGCRNKVYVRPEFFPCRRVAVKCA